MQQELIPFRAPVDLKDHEPLAIIFSTIGFLITLYFFM